MNNEASPSLPKTYGDKGYAYELQDKLAGLQKSEELCDVTITVGAKTFPAHKCILVASSDYFSSMFLGHFKERNQSLIKLEGVTAHAFGQILNFAYTGTLSLEKDKVRAIYEAAEIFQYSTVKRLCVQFILTEMKWEDCLEYLGMAEKHCVDDIMAKAKSCIFQNFSEVVQLPGFLELSYEMLGMILSSDSICCESETEILGAACHWLEAHPEIDAQQRRHLLSKIRPGLLRAEEQRAIADQEDVITSEICQEIQSELLEFHTAIERQPLKQGEFCRPRGMPCLVTFGGISKGARSLDAVYGSVSAFHIGRETASRTNLSGLPAARVSATTVVCGNFMFVIGGRGNDVNGQKQVEATTFRYDALVNRWVQMSSMNYARHQHITGLIGEHIYVSAGWNSKEQRFSAVEKYSIADDRWENKNAFPLAITRMASCVYQGQLFASGGELEEEATSDLMYFYKESTDQWEQMGRLVEPRALHGMCADDKNIYVIGGRKPGQYHSSMEIFNPLTKQSTLTMHLPGCRDCVYPVLYEDHIYVAGGWSLGGRMDTILVYDTHSATWREMAGRLPKPVSSCGCAVLVLPRSMLGRTLRE